MASLYAEDKQKNSIVKQIPVSTKNSSLESVDSVAVVIYTDMDPLVLTKSELNRLSINGQKQDPKEVVLQRIMEYEALHVYHIPVSDSAVENYITSLQEQYHITREQLQEMFKNAGYSYQEGLAEFKRMLLIDALLNFKIKSRLVITEQDVRDYYNNHVQLEPAAYRIQKGFLGQDVLSDQQREALKKDGSYSSSVEWLTPYWLQDDEISDTRAFIKKLKLHQIILEKVSNGYEVIKLVKKRDAKKRSFEESYKEIVELLKQPLFDTLLQEYKNELHKKYPVVYMK